MTAKILQFPIKTSPAKFKSDFQQPVLTSHENTKEIEDLTDKESSVEILVDNLLSAWYNGDINKAKTITLGLYLEFHTKSNAKGKSKHDNLHR